MPWADEPDEFDPSRAEHILADRANATLMARWARETQARLVMEFLREERLIPRLNAFLKKRLR